tara:strand:- start:1418 stop:1609 length:192 start_codon:yes stop_codon:yes gene_type:complete
MLTIDEQEARAYQLGDITLARALAQLADAHAENDTLRALVRDALDGDAGDADWRERAQAAIED